MFRFYLIVCKVIQKIYIQYQNLGIRQKNLLSPLTNSNCSAFKCLQLPQAISEYANTTNKCPPTFLPAGVNTHSIVFNIAMLC